VLGALADGLAGLVAVLPRPVARGLCRGLGRLAGVVRREWRANLLAHLAAAYPDKRVAERLAICRGVYDHVGWGLADTLHFARLPVEVRRGLIVNWDELESALAADLSEGRGLVMIGAHLGRWQVLSGAVSSLAPVTGVANRYRDNHQASFVARLRKRLGVRVVLNDEVLLEPLRALQRNEIVVFLPDQAPRRGVGIELPFFGRPAVTTTFPVALARLARSALRPVYLVAEGRNYRAVVGERIAVPTRADGEAGLARATRAWQEHLEAEIRKRPEQWMWMHRRWASRKPKERRREAAQAGPARG
jgi:KDO2-lipid IV(A) lauroyltransferase